MRDTRQALLAGAEIYLNGHMACTVQKEIARGGSCIVYDGFYTAGSGVRKPVRIKECCPLRVPTTRDASGALTPHPGWEEDFAQAKAAMRAAFQLESSLSLSDGLTNHISCTWDLFEANNTVYILSTYLQGEVLSRYPLKTLAQCVAIAKNAAEVIQKIHQQGRLYLDLKPDNVFVLSGTNGMVQFFDFDTEEGFTPGFAAPEQLLGQRSKLGPYTDVYGVGALLFYLLFDRTPTALDCDFYTPIAYENSRFVAGRPRERLFFELDAFFRQTLANYPADRYPDMGDAVRHLTRIHTLAEAWCSLQNGRDNGAAGKKLRLYTLLCTPEDEEDPVLDFAEDIFSDSQNLSEEDVMELYGKAVYLYAARGDFAKAREKLAQAKRFVGQRRSTELRARYHYLWAIYYDAQPHSVHLLLRELDKAVRLQTGPGKCEYLLSKAAVLVRSHPEREASVRKALLRAKGLLTEAQLLKPSLARDFFLVCAWYFTLSRPDFPHAEKAMAEARRRNKALGLSDLENIDELLIPCANMMLAFGAYEKSEEIIREGLALCKGHDGATAYERKTRELLGCLHDIHKSRH